MKGLHVQVRLQGAAFKGPPYVLHPSGRTARIEEIEIAVKKWAFNRLMTNFMDRFGAQSVSAIRKAIADVQNLERGVVTIHDNDNETVVQNTSLAPALPVLVKTVAAFKKPNPPVAPKLSSSSQPNQRRKIDWQTAVKVTRGISALKTNPASSPSNKSMIPSYSGKSFFEEVLGDDFFQGGGTWLGFGSQMIANNVGVTLFRRVHEVDDVILMCGREPLYLTHDDEMWHPVILRGVYPDGRVD